MQEKVNEIVLYLNSVKTRCTYNAAGKALGISPQAFKKLVNEKKIENSWFVSTTTGEPVGYTCEQKHPDLQRTKRIITSSEVLTRNLTL